jgi:hypothetical protein
MYLFFISHVYLSVAVAGTGSPEAPDSLRLAFRLCAIKPGIARPSLPTKHLIGRLLSAQTHLQCD